MNAEQIRQAAEQYANDNAEGDYISYAEKDYQAGATQALTHGWKKVKEVPDDTSLIPLPLLIIYKAVSGNSRYTSGYYDQNDKVFYDDYDLHLADVLYWKYDDAHDILELLNEQ